MDQDNTIYPNLYKIHFATALNGHTAVGIKIDYFVPIDGSVLYRAIKLQYLQVTHAIYGQLTLSYCMLCLFAVPYNSSTWYFYIWIFREFDCIVTVYMDVYSFSVSKTPWNLFQKVILTL